MENVTNLFSPLYDELFIQNILNFKKNAVKRKRYAVFFPSFGDPSKLKSDFLIYGQAVNRWTPEFDPSIDIIGKDILKKAREYSNSFYKDEHEIHSPLDWINIYWCKSSYKQYVINKQLKKYYPKMTYLTFRSFFWNVTYKLICRYYGINESKWHWSGKMVWSNLYKIAPAEGGNPDNDECLWQHDISLELVRREIEEIKPKYCIILTNYDWWQPFQEHLQTKIISRSESSIIESIELYDQTKIIVTSRPFRGSSNQHVEEMLKKIGRCQKEDTFQDIC